MKYFVLFFTFILFFVFHTKAQNYFWVGFSDKNNSEFSLSNPREYLSERAMERRTKQNIPIDSLDLPLNSNYIDSVLTLDVKFVHASKWLNGITVSGSYETLEFIEEWSFVKETQLTKPGSTIKSAFNKFETVVEKLVPIDSAYYGGSLHQVGMLNGQYFHEQNYKGQGMQIAVIDGGFYNADINSAFDSLWVNNQILGIKDVVDPNSDFYKTNYHGMSVLSCMGGNLPGQLIGTAPKASYWLIRSEDTDSEYKIEEDNWVVAAEFADSVGVDIINSSLGYSVFYDTLTNHTYADMDGKTTRVTKAANIAASRGILVFTSAGNERDNAWQRIVAPSDGDLVIGVGAVDKYLISAPFSSAGPSADGDIKPNLSAMGEHVVVQYFTGNVSLVNGTSFASPILAGMAACLWQMNPERTAVEVKEAMESSAHRCNSPDSLVGYGVPDMRAASLLLQNEQTLKIENIQNWQVYPNPVSDQIVLQYKGSFIQTEINIELYTIAGQLIRLWTKPVAETIVLRDIPRFENGIFLLRINDGHYSETFKLSKRN